MRKQCILLVSIFFLFPISLAFANQEVSLQLLPQATIVGPKIRLNEVCTIVPTSHPLAKKLSEIVIGRAAPPGEAKEVSRSLIKMNLRRVGIYDQVKSITGPRSVRVKTAQKDITRVRVEEAIVHYIREHFESNGAEWRFEFQRIPEKIAGPAENVNIKTRLNHANIKKGYLNFEVKICNGDIAVASARVAGTLRTFENVAVASRKIDREQPVSRSDIAFQMTETTYISSEVFSEWPEQRAVESTVHIAAGKVITSRMVERPPAVRRGEKVDLEIRAGQVVLKTPALSQEDGYVDERIRVWAQDTRKTLKGLVIGEGIVRVDL